MYDYSYIIISYISHMLYVWYIYLHLGILKANVGKYSSTMEPMGIYIYT